MPRRNILIAAAIAVVLITGAVVAWFTLKPADDATQTASTASTTGAPAPSGPPGALPDPVIAVMDRGAILVRSKVGQDITRQMQVFTGQARDRLAGERRALDNEARAIQNGNLPEAERAKRIAAFQAREQRFAAASGREEDILKATMATAQNEIAKTMGPIVEALTKQQGINMVLDRAAVPVAVGPEFDLTAQVIAQLDAKMPAHQVTLVKPGN